MTDETSLLAAVLSVPEDDLPRLVYADWLDERGEASRASLIRVQIELARRNVRRGAEDDETWRMALDACNLIRDNRWAPLCFGLSPWFKERPLDGGAVDVEYEDPDGGPNPSLTFRRGFIEVAAAPLAVLLDELPPLLIRGPVTRVRVLDRRPHDFADGHDWQASWSSHDPLGGDQVSVLPDEVFQELRGGDLGRTGDVVYYASVANAVQDLEETVLRVASSRSERSQSEPGHGAFSHRGE